MYNKELANRFVKDYNLPIQITDEKYFFYFLDLYEKGFESKTKYFSLLDEIVKKYDSNPNVFLEFYYKTRNEIIETIEQSEAYKKFNTMDMSSFKVIKNYNLPKKDIFNVTNLHKTLLSIDLSKANFQALRFADKDIVLGTNTYDELISKFTDSKYILDSKYLRQVIFGKLNPSRHISVEKYIMSLIMTQIERDFYFEKLIPISMSNDEIVFDASHLTGGFEEYTTRLTEYISNTVSGIKAKVTIFNLDGIKFVNETSKQENTFFQVNNLVTMKSSLKTVPITYHAQIYSFLNGFENLEENKLFLYDNNIAKFQDNFNIYKI